MAAPGFGAVGSGRTLARSTVFGRNPRSREKVAGERPAVTAPILL